MTKQPLIKIHTGAPLAFERIVGEELATPLAEHGFKLQPEFNLYLNAHVTFERHRQGQRERISLRRAVYDNEGLQELMFVEPDEVDRAPDSPSFGQRWVSRHSLFVQLITDEFGTGHLHTDGQPFEREDKQRWDFGDESDLRRTLRERILPLLLTVGLQKFDDRLEDALMSTTTAA